MAAWNIDGEPVDDEARARDASALKIVRDAANDVVIIEGIAYAGQFFRCFARDIPLDTPMKITKREDGVVTMELIVP